MNDGWLEISLEVDGELAEAVAELMSRYIPSGIVIERSSDAGPPQGALRVYGYLPQDAQAPEARRRIEEGLWHLGRISPLPEPLYRFVPDEDWSQYWRENFKPLRVGKKLLILPSWVDLPDTGGRIPVVIDPGMAFGTGTHPTTSLCLELLEDWVRPESPVIDVGCGSGILAIASVKLGARYALGVDIDPQAILEAEKNASINRVVERVEFGIGSLAEVQQGEFSIQQAPVVIANILASTLTQLLAEGLSELISEGGVAILSGILEEQAGEVVTAAGESGLTERLRRQEGDWVTLVFQRPGSSAVPSG